MEYRGLSKLICFLKNATSTLTLKLLLIILLAAILPLLILNLFSYENSLKILQNNYIDSNIKTVEQSGQNINNYFEAINRLSLSPYSNSNFMKDLSFEPLDFSGTKYNEQFLDSILFSRNDIVYIYYYISKNKILYSFSKQIYSYRVYPAYEKTEYNIKAAQSVNGIFISPECKFINYNNIGYSSANKVIMYNRNMIDIATGKSRGVFTIALDSQTVGGYCEQITNKGELTILTDETGQIYYANQPVDSAKNVVSKRLIGSKSSGYYTTLEGGKKCIVIYCRTFNNMLLIKSIPYNVLQNAVSKSLSTNFLIIIITVFLITVLSVFLSFYLSVPIKNLAISMKKLSMGNFSIKIPSINRKDEIGQLIDGFNEMAERINNLINSEYKLRIAKKNAQISALQAQINPHFIYNALQSVGTLALRKNAPEIYTMSSAIANMLRYSLQDSTEMVPIRTEMDNVSNYLYIQKVRFGSQLSAELDIDEKIQEFLVPKLILQPLVENSIKYGIDGDKTSEKIMVRINSEGDKIVITVSDTGRGMTKKSMQMVREWIHQNDDVITISEHLGIKNVFNRLMLIYGEHVDIDIVSALDKGTTITIKIPDVEKSDKDESADN